MVQPNLLIAITKKLRTKGKKNCKIILRIQFLVEIFVSESCKNYSTNNKLPKATTFHIIIFASLSAKKSTLSQNGAIRQRRGSSRGGQRRSSNSQSIYDSMPINPVPGATLFAPHSSICLSAGTATVVEHSLARLADAFSGSEESILDDEEESKSTTKTEKQEPSSASEKSEIEAVTVVSVSNDHVASTNGSDSGGTPIKVVHIQYGYIGSNCR